MDDDRRGRLCALLGPIGPARSVADLPVGFLVKSAPSPATIVGTLPVRRRTLNVLRRFLATGPRPGPWTYGRLGQIPGFGLSCLADLLEAEARPRGAEPPAEERDAAAIGRAMALIMRRLPASEAELVDRLRRAGIPRGLLDLGEIERAARHLPGAAPFAVLRRDGLTLAVPAGDLARAATVYTLALRSMLTLGTASTRLIAFRAGVGDARFVRGVVAARRGFRWLDRRHDWFWYGEITGALPRAMVEGARRTPAGGDPQAAQELARACSAAATRELGPPPAVLAALARAVLATDPLDDEAEEPLRG